MTTKAGVGVSYKTDDGDVVKLDYGFFKQFMEFTFPEVNAKRKSNDKKPMNTISPKESTQVLNTASVLYFWLNLSTFWLIFILN